MMPEDQPDHHPLVQIAQLVAYDISCHQPEINNIKNNIIYWVAVARNQATRIAILGLLLCLDVATSLSAYKGGGTYACILLGGATYFINLWIIGIIARGVNPGGEHARQDQSKDQPENRTAQGGENRT